MRTSRVLVGSGVFVLFVGALLTAPPGARAEVTEAGAQRTGAPYFFVAGGDPQMDRLPLEKTRGEIAIAGTIAKVVVHQVFKNDGQKPIEGVYVFPASTRAAVHAMRMRIGNRTIEARIAKRAEARADYEAAKLDGKRASLLEQERPNVFTTSVANLMPGERIEVVLEYSELLVPENAVYELVYPAVVGPRYVSAAPPGPPEVWTETPYLQAGTPAPYGFELVAQVRSGVPIQELTSPSHRLDVRWTGREAATVGLADPGGGDRDFVLRYRLAGDQIETGVLLWSEPANATGRPGESFFSLMLEPPRRPEAASLPRREYIFLLDVSGSMDGYPLETAQTLMRDLLRRLRGTDLFDVVLFAGASTVWGPTGSLPATAKNVKAAVDLVQRQRGGGGTELLAGLRAAYAIPEAGAGTARSVVVITDGYVGVESEVFRFVRQHLDQANLFAFGIGTAVNRALIEGMARAGLGEPFVVLDAAHAEGEAAKLRTYVEQPVLTDIAVRFDGFDAFDVAPEKIPDLLAERPLQLIGKYRPGAKAGRIEVSGRNGQGVWRQVIEVAPSAPRPENAALRPLWARRRVAALEDDRTWSQAPEVERGITDLGLAYDLLTTFTSFVAIDSEVVNHGGATQVRQPLPLPAGVPNSAVGGLYGIGGLGIVGTGTGGGGTGFGTLHGGYGYGRVSGGLQARRVSVPQVIPGQVVVRGALDKTIIQRIFRLHLNEIRYCYEQALGTAPELAGRVVLALVVDANGKVTTSSVSSSTLGNAKVEACVTKAAARWAFPVVTGGGVVIINYPFNFQPRQAGPTTAIPVTSGRRRRRPVVVRIRWRSCRSPRGAHGSRGSRVLVTPG